jgi:hypothetical protein
MDLKNLNYDIVVCGEIQRQVFTTQRVNTL